MKGVIKWRKTNEGNIFPPIRKDLTTLKEENFGQEEWDIFEFSRWLSDIIKYNIQNKKIAKFYLEFIFICFVYYLYFKLIVFINNFCSQCMYCT